MSKSKTIILAIAVIVIATVGVFWFFENQNISQKKELVSYVDRGMTVEVQEHLDGLIADAQKRLDEKGGQDLGIFLELGSLYYQTGNLEASREQNEKILKIQPNDTPALENLGQTLKEMEDFAGAEDAWRKAITHGAQEQIYFRLSEMISKEFPERNEEAREVLEDGVATIGQTPGLMISLGNWYREEGQYEKAISHYQVAAKLDPDNSALQSTIQEIRDEWTKSLSE